MDDLITRRRALAGGAATIGLAGCNPGGEASSQMSPADAEHALARIEAQLDGRVGVHVMKPGDARAFGRRIDERFAMCSTFKWLAALFALRAQREAGGDWGETIPYGVEDLVSYAPVTKPALEQGRSLTLEDVARAAARVSDNPAANLLLARIGGPAGFTEALRAVGDDVTRLDRWELELNENLPGDPRDTTTPVAMTGLILRLLFEAPSNRTPEAELVRAWMTDSPTGQTRVRKGLPADWTVADKTGTSFNGAVNDVGFATPPGAGPVFFAAYIDAGERPREDIEAAHAEIGSLIAGVFAAPS
ncbi:MAG: class A beta-lactamase [Pseudomonadota bacterium]